MNILPFGSISMIQVLKNNQNQVNNQNQTIIL